MAESTSTKLDKAVFGVEVPNHELLKVAYESYLAEKRQVGAKTLKRGEVRGGGRKPWRQKGLGRARFGSSRNPIWRGGGVVFGPSGNENYTRKIAKNAKRVAVKQALTLANQAKKVSVVEMNSKKYWTGKTKDVVRALKDWKIESKRRILLVMANYDDEHMRGVNNLPNVKLITAKYLTVFDILNADAVVFEVNALQITTDWLKGVKADETKGGK
jgi:large subunit ribosomal protein L4